MSVTDPGDARIADYARLTDVGHRVAREPAAGIFIAEGDKVLTRALRAGFTPRSLLLAPNRVGPAAGLIEAVAARGAPVYVAGSPVLERLTGYHVHRGLLAAMNRRPLPEPGELLADARRLLVVEDVVDHTNLGAVFRSGAALGVDAVLVTPACADPLYRRAIRTSMGTVFTLGWTRLSAWPEQLATLREAGFLTAALHPDAADGVSLDELAARVPSRLALILGTEGEGLRRGTAAAADLRVHIPMATGIDSLNVAAAAAVACYALRPAMSS